MYICNYLAFTCSWCLEELYAQLYLAFGMEFKVFSFVLIYVQSNLIGSIYYQREQGLGIFNVIWKKCDVVCEVGAR